MNELQDKLECIKEELQNAFDAIAQGIEDTESNCKKMENYLENEGSFDIQEFENTCYNSFVEKEKIYYLLIRIRVLSTEYYQMILNAEKQEDKLIEKVHEFNNSIVKVGL